MNIPILPHFKNLGKDFFCDLRLICITFCNVKRLHVAVIPY